MDENECTLEVWVKFRSLFDFLNHGARKDGECFSRSPKLLADRYTLAVMRIYPHILIEHAADVYERFGPPAPLTGLVPLHQAPGSAAAGSSCADTQNQCCGPLPQRCI
eukprot:TRINITY_DN850_c0_g1_i3.p4 TRINITY_DN850_c0_g1~~TRINITY_DN850_c0_g1_i3.p4  ORF type:complete len:108 (+),score=15.57 TRINITY_DN850_c0_g1_i3:1250-1573(+)